MENILQKKTGNSNGNNVKKPVKLPAFYPVIL